MGDAQRPLAVGRLANAEAAALGHDYLGTEHLLLALASQEGSLAAWSLAIHGVRRELLRAAIARIVQTAPSETQRDRPWTLRARKAVELAIGEARALGHSHVSSEHLLLALLRVADGVALRAVHELGADVPAIRRTVLKGLEQV